MNNREKFRELIKQRSEEHEKAIKLLSGSGLTGQVMSILRQELDSMVRVIFLSHQPLSEKSHLINQTLAGEQWRHKGSNTKVTDREMVNLADRIIDGWVNAVYTFGCSFIHLSSYHDYATSDPFLKMKTSDITVIKEYLNNYHHFPLTEELNMKTIAPYLPLVFEKIKSNMGYELNKV